VCKEGFILMQSAKSVNFLRGLDDFQRQRQTASCGTSGESLPAGNVFAIMSKPIVNDCKPDSISGFHLNEQSGS
jgi:hypothetical protein